MTVHEVRDLLTRHALMLLVAMTLGVGAGLVVASLAEERYTARADVFLGVNNAGATATDVSRGADYSQAQAKNFASVATREVVLQTVIDDLDLDTTPAALRNDVEATVPADTSVISVRAEAGSAQAAADLANAMTAGLTRAADQLLASETTIAPNPVRLEVIETAVPPGSPSAPSIPVHMLGGLLLGLVLGVVLAALRDATRTRPRSPEHLSEIVDAPIIGAVTLPRRESSGIATGAAGGSLDTVDAGDLEAFRDVRASLRFLQEDRGLDGFVFASTRDGHGAAEAALGAAAALAAARPGVCLVEADLRSPVLADRLGLRPGPGLAELLAGQAGLDRVVQTWGESGLSVITAGSALTSPAELLSAPGAREVLQGIGAGFDLVVVSAPAVLDHSDAVILARAVGGLVLVVDEGRASVDELAGAAERVRLVTPVVGALLTRSGSRTAGSFGAAEALSG